jgi:hypothetical protein
MKWEALIIDMALCYEGVESLKYVHFLRAD